MAKLVDQLRQLRADLVDLIQRDPEQEVTGQALPLIDAVVSEARNALPPNSTLGAQIVDIISVETIEAGDPLRAADALVIVGQLLAVLDNDVKPELIEADRRLFASLTELLPSSAGVMRFLRDHDFGASFMFEWLVPLDELVQRWDDAEHCFHDSAVQDEMQALHDRAAEFIARLSIESGPEPGGRQAVVVAEHRDTFRLGQRPKDVERVDQLNKLATDVYEQHQQLVQVARRRLAL